MHVPAPCAMQREPAVCCLCLELFHRLMPVPDHSRVMAGKTIALDSHRGQQDLFLKTQELTIGGLTGIPGRAPARLALTSHLLADKEAGRGSSLSRTAARQTEGLAALYTQIDWRALTSQWSLSDDPDHPQRSAGYDIGGLTEVVSKLCQQGRIIEAVEALGVLVERACPLPKSLFYAVLRICVVRKEIILGRRVHGLAVKGGYESDTFLCNHILRMYVSHARLEEAMDVFTVVSKPDAFTWSAIISAHVKQGQAMQGIELYSQMRRSSVKPDGHVFVAALQTCARGADFTAGRQVHADVLASETEPDLFVLNSLVDMYAKCGRLEDAQRLFDGLLHKDIVTWNAMIAGYSQQGMGQEALRLHDAMQKEGIVAPDAITFACLLQACAALGAPALETGKQLHARIEKQGLRSNVLVTTSLINMFAKCGSLGDARRVFDGLGQKDVSMWNAMIAGYSQEGMAQEALRLHSALQEECVVACNSVTFACLLQACASLGTPALEKGKQLHAQIRQQGLEADVVVGSSLVNMYAKCGDLVDAHSTFDRLDEKNVVTWTALLAGYSQQGLGQEALHVYSAMQEEGIAAPDSVTLVCLLQACASVGAPALETGKQLHAQIGQQGLQVDSTVGNNLIDMYAKCGSLEDAQSVFEGLGEKDVVTWTALIAGYSQQGMDKEALHLFNCMKEDGIVAPDSVTFVCLLQACANLGPQALETGKQLHAQIQAHGLQAQATVGNNLVNMYAKCGSIEDAQNVFSGLGQKDVVTWTALIAGYSQQGLGQEALLLYRAREEEGISAPNSVTFVCLLQACAGLAALNVGRQLHAQIEDQGLQTDVTVSNSLVNMYAKCGSMADAQQVFDTMCGRDIVAWNALIAGYSRRGQSAVVFDLVQKMGEDGILPNGITFLSLLTACSHAGLVNKGHDYFEAMSRDYGITPTAEHYTCMVDLLGRAGQLEEALAAVRAMPVQFPDAWHALLGACQKWSNVEVGRFCFDEALKLDENDASAYVLMSNIFIGAQMWEEAKGLQARRRSIGAWKQPGQSWWTDMDGLVHSFVVGEKLHFKSEHIMPGPNSVLTKRRERCATSKAI